VTRARAHAGLALVACLWLGTLIGVSFIATIAKFYAPSLTMPVALDVGRHTFAALARIEWGFAAVVAALIGLAGFRRLDLCALGAIVAILFLQAIWLLPALDARVTQIMAGGMSAPSGLHVTFVACELVKILVLSVLASALVWPLSRRAWLSAAGHPSQEPMSR
jgi:hypothetical protein